MEQLTQTISNIVGIMMGVVGAVGVGYFVYGAFMYMTAGGGPQQMDRGKSAMLTALAGVVLALLAYVVVEVVTGAIVDPAIEVDIPEPTTESGSSGGNAGTGNEG